MASYSTSLKTWGSAGAEYPDSYNYVEGEQPVDDWDNFFNAEVVSNITTIVSALNDDVVQVDGSNALTANLDVGDNDLLNVGSIDGGADTEVTVVAGDDVKLGNDLLAVGGELIWDESASHIPNARLETTSLTVAGNSVSLGGSTGVALGDLSDVTATGEGAGNGFDSDLLDGREAADLDPSFNDGATTALIASQLKFGAEGSSTTSTSYSTVAASDISFDPDDYKDTDGNLYVRVKAHLKHNGAGTTFARMYRQNAASAVSGSEVSVSGDGWGFADSGWIDFSGETGDESYQLQIKTDDGAEGRYNSVILYFGVPT